MNPIQLIVDDRNQARNYSDPNAEVCFLATANSQGQPYVRTLVLREINENRLGIYLNKGSPKWKQLLQTADYQLLLFYPSVQRQYRLSGSMREIPPATVGEHWKLRPHGSKYLDYFYRDKAEQGSMLQSRDQLTSGIGELMHQHPNPDKLVAPAHAIGVELVIDCIDRLDLSNSDRIHDRRRYVLVNTGWTEQVLVP